MWNATNDTLLLDAPVVRGERATRCPGTPPPGDDPLRGCPDAGPPVDRTAELARIIRHALRHRSSTSPLERAIRTAVQRTDPGLLARPSEDEEARVRQVARQMSVLLAQRAPAPASPHRETVHN
jgi:hypothetical protein